MTYRQTILGVPVDLVSYSTVLAMIEAWRQRGRSEYIVLTNPHCLMECERDPAFRAATSQAELILPDGIGVIWAARMLGARSEGRVTGPTLMLEVCSAGRELGYRHVFWGGNEGVSVKLSARLRDTLPGLQVVGCFSPPFRPLSAAEEQEQIDRINELRPDIVWLGVGAPKQEKYMARWHGRIAATAMIGVGAAFDFHSGAKPWAPKLVRAAGLEWAFRLASEPRRLWRRNLDSPRYLARVLQERLNRTAAAAPQRYFPSKRAAYIRYEQ